jgi:hypothetical protein
MYIKYFYIKLNFVIYVALSNQFTCVIMGS